VDDQAARDQVARVEGLLDEIEALPNPAGREKGLEVVQALVELYGEGLFRIMDQLSDQARAALASDELVEHLLLLHDLHPVPLEERVQGALEEVRPYLDSHGGGVEVIAIEDDVVRLRLQGSCSGCPSSTVTLKLAIEDAIHKAAPDVAEIVAEGVVPEPTPAVLQIQLPQAAGQQAAGPPADSWATAGSLAELSGGGAVLKRVSGEDVLFARLGESVYAYRPPCPACGETLGADALQGTELVCPSCSNRYDAMRAGRCLESPQLNLEPVPLLSADSGLVKIALGAAAA
jgi:Fe-S cluster biogenesis protein NfuA/nitrite reductase/ring-hydroxylating ferredoxin subunit